MGYSGPEIEKPQDGDMTIWPYGYVPSLALGIVGCLLSFLVAMPHLWWFIKKRGTRSVHGLLYFAGIIDCLGFGARLSSNKYPFNGMSFLLGLYLIQLTTILIPAALYKAIQRVIKYTPVPEGGKQLSPMRPRSLITTFCCLDALWVIMQMMGQYFVAGAEASKVTDKEPMFGLGTSMLIFLAGNVLQAITILIVTAFVIVIYKRSSKLLASVPSDSDVQYPFIHPLLRQILISLGLYFVRLIVRIAGGAQGAYGYALVHEWIFGVFEWAPIMIILILWAAKPLYIFIFPLGHKHGEGAHTHAFAGERAATSGENEKHTHNGSSV